MAELRSIVDGVRGELEAASRCDADARAHRRAAGELLAELRHDRRRWQQVVRQLGISMRTAELLERMAEAVER